MSEVGPFFMKKDHLKALLRGSLGLPRLYVSNSAFQRSFCPGPGIKGRGIGQYAQFKIVATNKFLQIEPFIPKK